MTTKLYDTPCCTIHHWAREHALHVEWHYMHKSAELREALNQGFELCRKHHIKHWIADVSAVTTPTSKEDQVWIAENGGRFFDIGLASVITVLPASAIAKMTTKGWQNEIQKTGAQAAMVDVGSLADARKVISTLAARKAA